MSIKRCNFLCECWTFQNQKLQKCCAFRICIKVKSVNLHSHFITTIYNIITANVNHHRTHHERLSTFDDLTVSWIHVTSLNDRWKKKKKSTFKEFAWKQLQICPSFSLFRFIDDIEQWDMINDKRIYEVYS